MARGKEAAQAANRRAETAQQELHELRQQFATFREEAKQREDELLAELQKTKNRLVSEVDALAGDAVRSAEMRVEQVRAEEREAARQRVIAGFALMHEITMQVNPDLPRFREDEIADIADILGVNAQEFREACYPELASSYPRSVRRRTNARIRRGVSLQEQRQQRPRMFPGRASG
jgi:hypothetical protein